MRKLDTRKKLVGGERTSVGVLEVRPGVLAGGDKIR